jgi:hypothetical protein
MDLGARFFLSPFSRDYQYSHALVCSFVEFLAVRLWSTGVILSDLIRAYCADDDIPWSQEGLPFLQRLQCVSDTSCLRHSSHLCYVVFFSLDCCQQLVSVD